jgi:hypothetical protein
VPDRKLAMCPASVQAQSNDGLGSVGWRRGPRISIASRKLKRAFVASALLALGGCVNLSAVSDFAKLGSDVTSSSAAIDSYPDAARALVRTASPGTIAARRRQAAKAVEETKVADLGMKTLSLYLSTLAKLADDKAADIKSSTSSIAASLKSLNLVRPGISGPATVLIDLIGGSLDAWRRQAVSNLIDAANTDVQKLGLALADFAHETAQTYERATLQTNAYYDDMHEKTPDPAVQEMLDEWRAQHIADYRKARDQASAAETVLRKIVQGQADLQAHKNDLTGDELKTLLGQYEADITAAAKLLPFSSVL